MRVHGAPYSVRLSTAHAHFATVSSSLRIFVVTTFIYLMHYSRFVFININNVDVLTIIPDLSRLIGITFAVLYVANCHRIVIDAYAVQF